MAIEIELKAHLESLEAGCQKVRSAIAVDKESTYLKSDSYFINPVQPEITEFRLRESGDRKLVTKKVKTLTDGIEVNDEIEFEISDAESFKKFAELSGYQIGIRKVKKGVAFHSGDFLLEVSDIEGLGAFIEIELMLPDEASPSKIEAARERILTLLDSLSISREKIESRYYTDLLRAL